MVLKKLECLKVENRPASSIYYQYFQLMDIEEFIKIEDNQFANMEIPPEYFPHRFYDQESDLEEEKPCVSLEQILQEASQLDGFIDMPLEELVNTMAQNYNLEDSQISHFRKRVRKTKNILKRNRAKGRKSNPDQLAIIERKPVSFEESSGEKETQQFQKQIKKQRNRISAQISRDRKKNYVSNLQKTNSLLAEEAERLKKQNEELKKLIEEKSGTSNKKKGNQNKFMKLLILLGIIFFLYIVQDIFNIKLNKSKGVIQTQQVKSRMEMPNVSKPDSKQIVEEIKNELMSDLGEQQEQEGWGIGEMGSGIKDLMLKKISELQPKIQQFSVPRHLLSSMMQAKSCI